MDPSLRALNGFGLGARVGERRKTGDPRGWLRSQLRGGAPVVRAPAEATPEALTEAIRAFRSIGQAGSETARQEARQESGELSPEAIRQAINWTKEMFA